MYRYLYDIYYMLYLLRTYLLLFRLLNRCIDAKTNINIGTKTSKSLIHYNYYIIIQLQLKFQQEITV